MTRSGPPSSHASAPAADLARLVRLPLAASVLGDAVIGLTLVRPDASPWTFVGLALASVLIYLGGMALNDLFDADIDRERAPHRPIPSGAVSAAVAARVGLALVVAGVAIASFVSIATGVAALALVVMVLAYDGALKRWAVVGVLAMGLCRGLDVGLGIAAAGTWAWPAIQPAVVAAIVHTAYTAGITAVSLLEDDSTPTRATLRAYAALAVLPLAAIPFFVPVSPLAAIVPLVFLVLTIFFPFRAMPTVVPIAAVKATVGRGVRGLLLVCAAWAWGAESWAIGAALIAIYALAPRPRSGGTRSRRVPR